MMLVIQKQINIKQKMYNSDDGYEQAEDSSSKQQRQNPGSMESTNNMKQSRPKNQISNLGIKPNGISGAYSRIVPRKPIHDYQRLYSENIQLREKIKVLQDNNTKLKTRLSMADREKQTILMQFKNIQSFNVIKDRRPSNQSLMKKNQKTHKFANDENRRILHQYKDEINKLTIENGRLKKTVKYTQIKEIQVENQYLQSQIRRLKQYVEDIIENTEYDEYEKQIEKLNKQIQADKDQIRSLHLQYKKKDEELQDCKEKIKALANRKIELEKKYTRDFNNMKGEINRFRDRQKQVIITNAQAKRQSSQVKSRVNQSNKFTNCSQCKQKDNLIATLKNQKSKIIQENQKKISQLNKTIAKKNQSPKQQGKKTNGRQQLLLIESKQQNNQNLKKSSSINKEKEKIQNNLKDQQDSYEDLYQESENNEESQDKVDVLHVDLDSKKNTKQVINGHKQSESYEKIENKNNEDNQEGYSDDYGQEFDKQEEANKKMHESEEEQEVLFQKDSKKAENAAKKRPHSKNKKKKQQKNTGASKAEKILKQTIHYRLIAQRYTYDDFQRDLKDSGATQFTLEDLIGMLSNEPFFLTEEHLEMTLFRCFEKQELGQDDSMKTNDFLKKMKLLIGQISLNTEQDEEKILKKIQAKIGKNSNLISQEFQRQGKNQVISKKLFVKILKQKAKLTQKQIEQSLAESSVVSTDIAHISYYQFLQKILS